MVVPVIVLFEDVVFVKLPLLSVWFVAELVNEYSSDAP